MFFLQRIFFRAEFINARNRGFFQGPFSVCFHRVIFMRWFTFFCILLCISLFQTTVIQWVNIGVAVPDIYFPLIIFYSFLADMKQNAIANWFTGLSKDMFSEGNFGINAIFFVAIGFLAWSVRDVLYRGHVITQIFVTFIFSILYYILYASFLSFSFRTYYFSEMLWMILTCSLYTAVTVPPMFWIFNKLQPTKKAFHKGRTLL